MKNSKNNPDRQSVNAALRMIDALMSDDTDPELAARMREWFAEEAGEPAKQAAFTEYSERIPPHTGQLRGNALQRYKRLALHLDLHPTPTTVKLKSRRALQWQVAVVLAAVAAVGAVYFTVKTAKPLYEMRITSADRIQQAFLPDSSFVSVSPRSTLYYCETPEGIRKVELSGGAFFKAVNDGRPFRVEVAGLNINVLGTEFDVSAFPQDTVSSVSLFRGELYVGTESGDAAMAAGERLVCNNLTGEFTLSLIGADEMTAKGYKPTLRFDDATLGEVLRALGTVFGVEVEIADDIDAGAGKYSLNLENKTLEGALKLLAVMEGISYSIEDGRVTVSRKR